ncbi:uncharacterized protein [Littorina saxatilis]|uniref:EGF-like domain-containing protein n=1 Tax=Littorina saxatilis TaxID=31220 RepID=A0AAN9GS30_9CAEN
MGSIENTSVLVLLCLVVGVQSDSHLSCPKRWYAGYFVKLTCEYSKASVNQKCAPNSLTKTHFLRNTSIQCSVPQEAYGKCLASDPSYPPSPCWCQQSATHFKTLYQFRVDHWKHAGSWQCQSSCSDTSGKITQLKMTQESSCTGVTILGDPCDYKKCGIGTCAYPDSSDNTNVMCICPEGYTYPDCGPCPLCDCHGNCNTAKSCWVCVLTMVIVVILALGSVGMVLFMRFKSKRQGASTSSKASVDWAKGSSRKGSNISKTPFARKNSKGSQYQSSVQWGNTTAI